MRLSSGETVDVAVSGAFADPPAEVARWAEFFGSLPHGTELSTVRIRVVGASELAAECGNEALGCYRPPLLVIPGEPVGNVPPEHVARHEYGHHVAATRLNPPWRPSTWGPKYWATAAGVCARVGSGTAHPGNEAERYGQNPGEAFAEVYRVLSERASGATGTSWKLVDRTFYPDAVLLDAALRDVVAPWTGATVSSARIRLAGGRRSVTRTIATPLDGVLQVRVTFPRGALVEASLLGGAGGAVVARGLWAGSAEKRVTATVCGQRAFRLRLSSRRPAAVSVHVSRP